MNRFQLQQQLDGVRATLKDANSKLNAMYGDTTSTMENRQAQALIVKDLEEREAGLNKQVDALDKVAEAKLKAKNKGNGDSEEGKVINAKAELVRSVMANKPVSQEVKAVLGTGETLGGGDKILPSTMTNELLHEPMAKNPLRNISTFTNITNLEIPRIAFALDDDDFLDTDTDTAKELKASTDTVVFGRNKFKVFCDITETVLKGTNTNLVAVVNAGLESGLAKKEKRVAFATTNPTTMSFYYKDVKNPNAETSDYVIKKVNGKTLYDAIIAALGDLEDDYSENAKVTMRKADYLSMVKELANGNASLYAAPPEQVLGCPVEFCDSAAIPVVGDFSFSHFNYDEDMIYDRDKNVKTGIESFVLTAWLDHQIKLKSAFRLAIVTP